MVLCRAPLVTASSIANVDGCSEATSTETQAASFVSSPWPRLQNWSERGEKKDQTRCLQWALLCSALPHSPPTTFIHAASRWQHLSASEGIAEQAFFGSILCSLYTFRSYPSEGCSSSSRSLMRFRPAG